MAMINNGTHDHLFTATGSFTDKKTIARLIVDAKNFSSVYGNDTF